MNLNPITAAQREVIGGQDAVQARVALALKVNLEIGADGPRACACLGPGLPGRLGPFQYASRAVQRESGNDDQDNAAGEGEPWYIASDWCRRSETLFGLAAEIAAKYGGREPNPNLKNEEKKK